MFENKHNVIQCDFVWCHINSQNINIPSINKMRFKLLNGFSWKLYLFVLLKCGSFFTRIRASKKNVLAAYRKYKHVIIYFYSLILPIIITLPFKIFIFSLRTFLLSILSPHSRKKRAALNELHFPISSNFKHWYKYSKPKLMGKLDLFNHIIQT